MASDITNGKGGVISVTATPTQYTVGVEGTGTTLEKTANVLKVWNEGSATVYAIVNAETTDYAEASAIPIPAWGNFTFYSHSKPIVTLVVATATGETSTAHYGAY